MSGRRKTDEQSATCAAPSSSMNLPITWFSGSSLWEVELKVCGTGPLIALIVGETQSVPFVFGHSLEVGTRWVPYNFFPSPTSRDFKKERTARTHSTALRPT